ncbi:MAG: nitronate monooxygenase [Acidobacteriota bacterium]|nr:nitronate monooxygenase [Acidobacteriota bacterium]
MSQLPVLIQGGMGAAVSNWRLAQTVARCGQLGVVSSVALDTILSRRLQDGDPGGYMRRGLELFPFPEIAERILAKHYRANGRGGAPYKLTPMLARVSSREATELVVAGNFVEVALARQGHSNPVGINLMEKIQLHILASAYGCMLAGVDYILMGAGIPLKVPGALDALAAGQEAAYPLSVTGAQPGDDCLMRFDPREFCGGEPPLLPRPKFLAIISSNALATTMLRRANGRVDGFIIEGPTAGGHNAPPRGQMTFNERGECLYGERDRVDFEKIRQLGVPFWLAGGYGTPEKLAEALALGAAGVQVGTAFALCEESGLRDDYKAALIAKVQKGEQSVFTDPRSSPTGFPFKAAQLEGTSSEPAVYAARQRICDIGVLREAYRTPEGKIAYRCAAEPEEIFVAKGGALEETVGRKCLCNCLLADVGLQQIRKDGSEEPGMVTCGDDMACALEYMAPGASSYSAADVVRKIMQGAERKETLSAAPTLSVAASNAPALEIAGD